MSRMLTVVTTLRSQNRNILAFLTDAIQASRTGSDTPCLLPSSTLSTQSMPLSCLTPPERLRIYLFYHYSNFQEVEF
ncbi:MAG: hypothetical protein F6K24_35845 [Okeania sp. SIO2D1]|nr:hypothetical protein [Okeania sp. SIO2D1]